MSDKQDIEEFFQKVSDHLDQVNTLIAAAWFIGPDRMAWKDSVETCREELRDFQRELVERYTGRKARRALDEQAHGHSPRNAPPDYKLPPKDPAPVDTPTDPKGYWTDE